MDRPISGVVRRAQPQDVVERCEHEIVDRLLALGIIHLEFTGSLTLHFRSGGISDYDRQEKGLRKKISLKG